MEADWRPSRVHVLGHPDLPMDTDRHPEDAQVRTCETMAQLLARAAIPFVYYGLSGSRVPASPMWPAADCAPWPTRGGSGRTAATGAAGASRHWSGSSRAERLRRRRSGVPASEPDAVARRFVADAGYGVMPHHAGHCLGLLHPERPYLAPWETLPLEELMVIAIEPGLTIPGRGYMRIERNYVVRADGVECLSHFPCELYACG